MSTMWCSQSELSAQQREVSGNAQTFAELRHDLQLQGVAHGAAHQISLAHYGSAVLVVDPRGCGARPQATWKEMVEEGLD
jgi:hypothetical protein